MIKKIVIKQRARERNRENSTRLPLSNAMNFIVCAKKIYKKIAQSINPRTHIVIYLYVGLRAKRTEKKNKFYPNNISSFNFCYVFLRCQPFLFVMKNSLWNHLLEPICRNIILKRTLLCICHKTSVVVIYFSTVAIKRETCGFRL